MNSIVLDTVPIWTLILGVGVFLYVLLDGFDLGEGRALVVGFGHCCFHTSSRSSVVVIVASSDSMWSMIVFA